MWPLVLLVSTLGLVMAGVRAMHLLTTGRSPALALGAYLVLWSLAMASAALSGCAPAWQPPAPVPIPPGEDACPAACDHLDALGCPWGADTPEGSTCEHVCRDTEATGWSTMHPRCIASARDCAEADRVAAEGCTQ